MTDRPTCKTDRVLIDFDRDRFVLLGLGIYVLLIGAYLLILPQSIQAELDDHYIELAFLGVFVILLGKAACSATGTNARIFWGLVTLGYSAWLLEAIVRWLMPDISSTQLLLFKDILFLFYTASIAVAIELRLDTYRDAYWLQRRSLYAVGGLLLVFAMFGYFAILPLHVSTGRYVTPYYLYAALDMYLSIRFLTAAMATERRSWKRVYRAFSIVFFLILIADMLTWLFRAGHLAYIPGHPINLVWFLWYAAALVTSNLQIMETGKRRRTFESHTMTPAISGMMLLGLSIPFLHALGYGTGIFYFDARDPREVFVAIWIVGITGILYGLHKVVTRNVQRLDLDKALAEQRTREIEAQLERELRIRSLGRLSAGLAHDFGNTISAIAMHAKAIENSPHQDPLTNRQVTGLTQAIVYAQNLVTKLSLFGGSSDSAIVETFDIGEEIQKTIDVIRPSLGNRIDLTHRKVAEPRLVNAEKSMVHQVLTNYVYNAIDAVGDQGHIDVSSEIVSAKVHCASCGEVAPGKFVALSVTDDGPGIDNQLANNLFEPLVTTKPVGKGSGLGLSTVHGIMHKIGGHVGLVTNPASGATFIAYFPLVEPAVE